MILPGLGLGVRLQFLGIRVKGLGCDLLFDCLDWKLEATAKLLAGCIPQTSLALKLRPGWLSSISTNPEPKTLHSINPKACKPYQTYEPCKP